MKQTLILAAMLSISAVALAFDPIVDARVLKNFNTTFNHAQHVRWEEHKNFYAVSFFHADIRTIVNYDKSGKMLSSIRYYKPQFLPLGLFDMLKREYSTSSLFGVTEVTIGKDVTYLVKVQEKKHWTTLKLDVHGNTEVVERFRKG